MDTRAFPAPTRLMIIALASIAVLLLLRPSAPATKLVSRWRPQPMLSQPDQPANHPNPPPLAAISGVAMPVDQFDISVDDGLYPDERQPLAAELQRALAYVTARFGSGPTGGRFKAVLLRDD